MSKHIIWIFTFLVFTAMCFKNLFFCPWYIKYFIAICYLFSSGFFSFIFAVQFLCLLFFSFILPKSSCFSFFRAITICSFIWWLFISYKLWITILECWDHFLCTRKLPGYKIYCSHFLKFGFSSFSIMFSRFIHVVTCYQYFISCFVEKIFHCINITVF